MDYLVFTLVGLSGLGWIGRWYRLRHVSHRDVGDYD